MASVDTWVDWCGSKGLKDSREYLKGVNEWRQVWRPKKVKVLLIAESHVRELKGDLRVRVKSPRGAPEGLPSRYVRLIYCLGYGDNSLCEPELKSNRGTSQFWQLFQIIADCSVDAKAPREITQKLKTLRKLQDRGVWLVDASIGALTQPGKTRKERRIKIKKRRTTIKESFERFVWPMVKRDLPFLEQGWVIGRGVGEALKTSDVKGMPNEISDRWIISQPNGQNGDQYRKDLRKLTHRISTCKCKK